MLSQKPRITVLSKLFHFIYLHKSTKDGNKTGHTFPKLPFPSTWCRTKSSREYLTVDVTTGATGTTDCTWTSGFTTWRCFIQTLDRFFRIPVLWTDHGCRWRSAPWRTNSPPSELQVSVLSSSERVNESLLRTSHRFLKFSSSDETYPFCKIKDSQCNYCSYVKWTTSLETDW